MKPAPIPGYLVKVRSAIKEMNMTNKEVMETLSKLEDIAIIVGQIKGTLKDEQPLTKSLENIWETSMELQRALCRPGALDGYKQDAMEQARRVVELLSEIGNNPTDQQVASIGYACDLTVDKILTFKKMSVHIARIEVLTGMAVGGHA